MESFEYWLSLSFILVGEMTISFFRPLCKFCPGLNAVDLLIGCKLTEAGSQLTSSRLQVFVSVVSFEAALMFLGGEGLR